MKRKSIVSIQLDSKAMKVNLNLKKAKEIITSIPADFEIIVFPELFASGYFWDESIKKISHEIQEDVETWLKEISTDYRCAVFAGIGRTDEEGRLKNSMVVIDKGKTTGYYDKRVLFRDEKEYFSRGEESKVFEIDGTAFGTFLCYEIGFPEIHRNLALKGAEVLIGSFAFGKSRMRFYDTLTRSRAIENGAYLVTSSMTGKSGDFEFLGHSRMVAPNGEILCDALEKPGWIYSEIDMDKVNYYRYTESEDSHGYFNNFDEKTMDVKHHNSDKGNEE